jgi:competence protein ComEC
MQFRFLLATGAFFMGVGLKSVFKLPTEVALWLIVLSFGLAVWWRRKDQAQFSPVILMTSICFLAISLGMVRTEMALSQFGVSPLQSQLESQVNLTGIVVAEPEKRAKTTQLYLEVGEDKILVSADRLAEIKYGDKLAVSGKLERPESFTTDLGKEFDYPGYLEARGVEYRISFATVKVVESGLGNPVISTLLAGKEKFIGSIEKIIPEPAVGLGSGLLLGVKSSLGEDIETDFRRTGIIHTVVLSGYNVMLVVTFILFCFSFFLPLRARVWAGLVAIICFALVVGLSATVVRASIMAGLVLLAQSYGKQYDILSGLFLAGLVMIIINPLLLIYDIGFQLSFMATLGLILIVPHFESLLLTEKTVKAKEFFLATLATQIAVLPLLLYHIGEVSLIALVVNVLVLPIVPLAMLLTFFTGVIGLVFPPVASIVGFVATISLNYILWVADWFADLPFASIIVPEFSLASVLLAYFIIGLILYFLSKKSARGTDSLTGWKIVEETEKVGEQSSPTPIDQKDLPIFFR